ncbi:hypothetical protein OY671_011938 [Metschnikowia pulcherrima]|nr:hypothetical protein OY671_011938 [Metschnikowia pulcherrima]
MTDAPETAKALVAPAPVNVTDDAGRSITSRKPGVSAQFRLVEAMGDSARNQVYMGMIVPLLFVAAIDGEEVSEPGTKGEVEASIKRLDEHGVQAVMVGVQEHFSVTDKDAAVKKSGE